MKKSLAQRCSRVHPYLPTILLILFCLQPILDILSYWQDALQTSIPLSFAPRIIIFFVLALGGYVLSEHKKAYWIMFAVLVVYWCGHLFACYTNGLIDAVEDTRHYFSVLQLPVTTIAMITCLRATGDDGLEAIQRGIFCVLLILAASFYFSVLTGTEPYTYSYEKKGICGYSFWPNAQSAILSVCAPISIGYIVQKRPKDTVVCVLTIVLACFVLYMHGTRLSYLCLIMTGIGMAIVFLLTKQPKKYAILLLVCTALVLAYVNVSPMLQNQKQQESITATKRSASDRLLELGELQTLNGTSQVLLDAGAVEKKTGMEALALAQPLELSTFVDVPEDDWASPYIAYCQTLELVTSGDKTYSFFPNSPVLTAKIIYAMDKTYEKYTGTQALPDYAGNTWAAKYTARAQEYGFQYSGTWDYATRAKAAALLYQILPHQELPLCHNGLPFEDVSPETEGYEAIMALAQAGIFLDVEEDEDGTLFRPDSLITHRELAVWLAALVNPAFRLCDEGYTLEIPTAATIDPSTLDSTLREEARLYPLYDYYIGALVDRFGIRKTAQFYEYTTDTTTIISEREWKLQYCYMLMDESNFGAQLFGLESTRLLYEGYSYDVENDVHAIYLRFGWVGLALMLLFLGFFLFHIVKAMVKAPKKYFTPQAGAIGIALIALLLHTYFTCGVLRRANTLFYFGALLAAAYYLVAIREYPEKAKR